MRLEYTVWKKSWVRDKLLERRTKKKFVSNPLFTWCKNSVLRSVGLGQREVRGIVESILVWIFTLFHTLKISNFMLQRPRTGFYGIYLRHLAAAREYARSLWIVETRGELLTCWAKERHQGFPRPCAPTYSSLRDWRARVDKMYTAADVWRVIECQELWWQGGLRARPLRWRYLSIFYCLPLGSQSRRSTTQRDLVRLTEQFFE